MNKMYFLYGALGMIVVLAIVFFLANYGNAEEISLAPTIINYSSNDLKVTFIDKDILEETNVELGTVELKSHNSVDEVVKVQVGNSVPMFYDFNFKEIYENGLGEVKFIDVKTKEEIKKDYYFVYWTNTTLTRDIYKEETFLIGKEEYKKNVFIGLEEYIGEGWVRYNSKVIPNESIRIGVMVNTLSNEFIDVIWTICGNEINKHAMYATYEIVSPNKNSVGGMTSNVLPSPYKVYQSGTPIWGTTYGMYDGNNTFPDKSWSPTGNVGWVVLDFGVGNVAYVTNLTNSNSVSGSSNANGYAFYGTADNTTAWTLLNSGNFYNGVGNYTVNFTDNNNGYRFYRLNITSGYGGSNVRIDEIYLHGSLIPPASIHDCKFNGSVKNSAGVGISGATVVIMEAEHDTLVSNVTTDANGLWNKNVTADGNYTVYAYQPTNKTRGGDIKTYVECIRLTY